MLLTIEELIKEWKEYKSYYHYNLYKINSYSQGTATVAFYKDWWLLNKDKDEYQVEIIDFNKGNNGN